MLPATLVAELVTTIVEVGDNAQKIKKYGKSLGSAAITVVEILLFKVIAPETGRVSPG